MLDAGRLTADRTNTPFNEPLRSVDGQVCLTNAFTWRRVVVSGMNENDVALFDGWRRSFKILGGYP